MPRSLVVVSESIAIMANCNYCLFEIDETDRADFLCSGVCVSPAIHRIKRVLREYVFDVGDEQFLMLLFMVNAENNNGLDFIKELVVGVTKQVVHVRIDRGAVAVRFLHCWTRN